MSERFASGSRMTGNMSKLKRQARRYTYKMQYKYKQDPFAFMILIALFFSVIFLIFAFRGLIATTFIQKIDVDDSTISEESIISESDNNLIESKPEESENKDVYIVEGGDTLYYIGLKLDKDYKEIAKLNDIKPPYNLSVGQELILP